jgi:protoporphyrinogen oxidase
VSEDSGPSGRNRVAVVGAGPAGLAAALEITSLHPELAVVVIEADERVGGTAGSFSHSELVFDYGSHRLHPSANEEVLSLVKSLLGDDLLERPRHGRIRMMGRLVHFPVRPLEMFRSLPLRFSMGVLGDTLLRPFRSGRGNTPASFSEAVRSGMGPTIADAFYIPYSTKIWGLDPRDIHPDQASRRIGSGIPGILANALGRLLGRASGGFFYYPKRGFGQIAGAMAEELERRGAELLLGRKVVRVERGDETGLRIVARAGGSGGGTAEEIRAGMMFSTIPVAELCMALSPAPPATVLDSADSLRCRSIVYCYLILDECDRYTPFDAHYFPESEVPFTRLSEPKNYSASEEPRGRTGLCVEIPCFESDDVWRMDADSLAELVVSGIRSAGLPKPDAVAEVLLRRRRNVYPLYEMGYRAALDTVRSCIDELPRVVTLGRNGLFAHDNVHHSMLTGIRAASCLGVAEGDLFWDQDEWARQRESFGKHVVMD